MLTTSGEPQCSKTKAAPNLTEFAPTTMLYDRTGILRKKVTGFEYTSVFEAGVKSLL